MRTLLPGEIVLLLNSQDADTIELGPGVRAVRMAPTLHGRPVFQIERDGEPGKDVRDMDGHELAELSELIGRKIGPEFGVRVPGGDTDDADDLTPDYLKPSPDKDDGDPLDDLLTPDYMKPKPDDGDPLDVLLTPDALRTKDDGDPLDYPGDYPQRR